MKKKKIALLLCATTIATNVGVVNAAEVQTSKEPTENLQLKNEEENSSQSGQEIAVTTGAGVVVETPEEDKDEIVNESEKVLKVNTLATTDAQVTIETPEGYNDHDYQQLVDFLKQSDNEGVTNASKCGVELTQEGLAKLFKSTETIDKELEEAKREDMDGENTYRRENPYVVWIDINGEKMLKNLMFFGRSLSGDIDISNCSELLELLVSGDYSNRTGQGDSNNFNNIEINNCEKLKYITLNNNNADNISINSCDAVTQLSISKNPITSFDFSKVPNVKILNVGLTNLTNLDLSSLDNLFDLNYIDTNLQSINLSSNAMIRNIAFSSLGSFKLLNPQNLINLEYVFTREESIGELDLSNNSKVNQFYINKLNLTKFNTATYSVNTDNEKDFKYYSYIEKLPNDHRNQECIGNNKYSEDTIELQNLSSTKTGEWTLTSRTDGSTKTVVGDSIPVSGIEGYDVTVSEISKDITVPDGYNEHDYKALYNFLAQTDENGISNAEKADIDLDNITSKNNKTTWLEINGSKYLRTLQINDKSLVGDADFSDCSFLYQLSLNRSNLENINLDNCLSLENVYLIECKIKNLSTSNLNEIKNLNLSNNSDLRGLDLSTLNININQLYTNSDYITDIDLSKFSNLSSVGIVCKNIKTFKIKSTQMESLDISDDANLNSFECDEFNISSNNTFKVINKDKGNYVHSIEGFIIQDLDNDRTGKWVLTPKEGEKTKTVYGNTLSVSEAQGYDVVVDKVDISIPKIEDIKVEKGTSIENVSLPGTLDVSFGDSTTTASVTWDTNNYNGDEDGTYTLIGTLEIPGIENLKVTANIIVGDSKDEADSSIVNISKLNDIEVEKGTEIKDVTLPKTVNIELSDSTTTEAEVTWDTSNYNGDVAGTYKLSGKISLPEGIINPRDLTATINVIVKESGETTSSLDKAYELIKSKLDTITYKNTTTEDSILSSLSTVTLPSDIAIEITESNLVKATYSKAGTLTLTLKIKSKNGESKELTYVGNIAKLTSSSSSGHSGGSSSNNSNSADSTETEDKNNDIVNDNKTENNAATTTVVKTPSGVAVNVPTDKQAWVADNGQWLLFDKGNKATGWNNVNSTWYYLDNTGIMKTGWVKDNANWYYLNGNGSMATGWVKENNTWYYLNGNGAMKTGWHLDNNVWYYLNSNGAMKTGWHLDSNGKWYYLNDNGSMAKDTYIDGYYVNANGEWE